MSASDSSRTDNTFYTVIHVYPDPSYGISGQDPAVNKHNCRKDGDQSPGRHIPCSNGTVATLYHDNDNRKYSKSFRCPVNAILILCISPEAHQIKVETAERAVRCLKGTLREGDSFGIIRPRSEGKWEYSVARFVEGYWTWDYVSSSTLSRGPNRLVREPMAGISMAIDALTGNQSASTPCPTIMVVSDVVTVETSGIESIIARANVAGIGIYTFGFGVSHDPEALVQLASGTRAAYTYVKDWMGLPDSLLACFRFLKRVVLENVKLTFRTDDSSPVSVQVVDDQHDSGVELDGGKVIMSLGNLCLKDQRDTVVHLWSKPDALQSNKTSRDAQPLRSPVLDKRRFGDGDGLIYFRVDVSWDNVIHEHLPVQRPGPLVVQVPIGAPCPRLHSTAMIPRMGFNPNITQRRLEVFVAHILSKILRFISSGQSSKAILLMTHICHVLQSICEVTAARPQLTQTNGRKGQMDQQTVIEHQLRWCGWNSRRAVPVHFVGSLCEASQSTDRRMMATLLQDVQEWRRWIAYPEIFSIDNQFYIHFHFGPPANLRI
ncbi:von Willebrand RING finger domain-containing protein [Fusarium pseudocircinatum]|uniref:von Willebrand RING finger domain-containing protein n=1 Tax=Fusarium pseudocircinatum TaxID=56676 RepID=A0A8H5NZV4_9HYPO|nr:von Willebrand RING finger domain-containing protein [Fusarium pseudocircinatum]